jgi:hypothetical protein
MNKETEEFLRTKINSLDCCCNMVNEIIEDEYLQDTVELAELFDTIQHLQHLISDWQETKKYI